MGERGVNTSSTESATMESPTKRCRTEEPKPLPSTEIAKAEVKLLPCTARMPEVGEKVRHLHGDTHKSSADGTSYAWRLAYGEVAEVVEADEDGDFRLKNPSGQESDFIHRQHFGYIDNAADAFGQHKILSVRFDDACTVHQISPYSEIYGLH